MINWYKITPVIEDESLIDGLKIEDIVDPLKVSMICPAASIAQKSIVNDNPIKKPILISFNTMPVNGKIQRVIFLKMYSFR